MSSAAPPQHGLRMMAALTPQRGATGNALADDHAKPCCLTRSAYCRHHSKASYTQVSVASGESSVKQAAPTELRHMPAFVLPSRRLTAMSAPAPVLSKATTIGFQVVLRCSASSCPALSYPLPLLVVVASLCRRDNFVGILLSDTGRA